MRAALKQRLYTAVVMGDEAIDSSHRKQKNQPEKKFDFKPTPLRIPFLIFFVIVFSVCIVLYEILLGHTVSPTPSVDITQTSSTPHLTPRREQQWRPRSVQRQASKRADVAACTTAELSAEFVSLQAVTSSLCSDFSQSYKPYTANLSWPLQTALSQWIVEYAPVARSIYTVLEGIRYCEQEAYETTTLATYYRTVALDCRLVVTKVFGKYCLPIETLYIEHFSFTSGISQVCPMVTDSLLLQGSQPAKSGTSDVPTDTVLIQSVPSDKTTIVEPASTPPASPAPALPTITIPATSTPSENTNLGSNSPLPTVTASTIAPQIATQPVETIQTTVKYDETIVPVVVTYATVNSVGEVKNLVTSINMISSAATYTTTNSDGQVQTVVTGVKAIVDSVYVSTNVAGQIETVAAVVGTLVPSSTSYLTTNSDGQVKTIVTAVSALVPAATTYLRTDSLGQAVTVVAALYPTASTYLTTDSLGQTVTMVAALLPTASTYLTTNAMGQIETVVAAIGALDPAATTYLTTNAFGEIMTVVVSSTVLAATVSTYTTTNSLGQVQTVVTPLEALAEVFSTYTTTDVRGEVQTVTTRVAANSASSALRYTTTTQYTSVVTTTGVDGKATTFSAVVVETVVLTTSPLPQTATRTTSSTSKASSSAQASFVLASNERMVDGTFRTAWYISAMYLPALIAVIIKAMWEMVFAAIKLVQPFERMTVATGAEAQYSIFAQYLSSSISLDIFQSLKHGNLLPLWSTIMYGLVTIGAPMASASMTVKSRNICIVNEKERRCDPGWVLNVPMVRGVEAMLVVCLVLVAVVAWSTWRHQSGLPADPSSLASIAHLANCESLSEDIRRTGTDADHSAYETSLQQHVFRLGWHKNALDQYVYGIFGSKDTKLPELSNEDSDTSTAYRTNVNRGRYSYHPVTNPATMVSASGSSYASTSFLSRARHNLATDLLGFAFPLALLAIILSFWLDTNQSDSINKFFNSNAIGPKFVLVTLATLSSLHLSHLERTVRIAEPFRRLAENAPRSHSNRFWKGGRVRPEGTEVPAETTLMISRSGTSYSNIPQCLSLLFKHEIHGGRMTYQTLMSITCILGDFNIIAVAGVAYNEAMTIAVYRGSTIASVIITGWIVFMYLVTLVWWRRCEAVRIVGGRSISKGVGTVGGVMRWLVGSSVEAADAVRRVAEERETWARWSKKNGSEKGEGGGTKVWFGKTGVVGADGRERWCIDFESNGTGEATAMRERRSSRRIGDAQF